MDVVVHGFFKYPRTYISYNEVAGKYEQAVNGRHNRRVLNPSWSACNTAIATTKTERGILGSVAYHKGSAHQ